MLHDILGFFFEGLAHCALLRFQANNINRLRFWKTTRGYQRNTGGLGVLREIVGGTISTSNAFDPTLETQEKKLFEKKNFFKSRTTYIRSEAFGIPTVASVVGHFVAHVLAETQFLGIHTDFHHVRLNSSHKVCQSFVGNDTFVNCLTNGFVLGRSHVHSAALPSI
jgi:hypothetical protein